MHEISPKQENILQEKGLSFAEVSRQLTLHGPNILVAKNHHSLLIEFFKSFITPLPLLLLVVSAVSALLGDIKDFVIIVCILGVSNIVSFYQHFKAESEAEKLKQKVQLKTTVIRESKEQEIPFSQVVFGDILALGVGDIIPADATILWSKEMTVDESLLTGEAFPVEKNIKEHALFMGTHILTGEARAVVNAVGGESKFGHLAKEILITKPQTSFDKGLKNFSMLIIKAIIILSILIVAVNLGLHRDLLSSILFALAIAVGLTPELLPVILTITLSRGARKMEQKGVVVKYLPAIQNLGNMNMLCTDKTGTLTENAIVLHSFEDFLNTENEKVLEYAVLTSELQSSFKNPMDKELLSFSGRVKKSKFLKIDEIPFDFTRKYLSVIAYDTEEKKTFLITKGAPHKLFDKITTVEIGKKQGSFTKEKRKELEKRYETLSSKGLRVIAICKREIKQKKGYGFSDESELCFVGYVCFADPVKSTVKHVITELEAIGVQIKILTGDNEFVTRYVCQEAGIPADIILIGHEIDKMDQITLSSKVSQTTIFARLSPEQKARVIQCLKQLGNVVGYIGDGINDAPPLKVSDVGISVNNGSDIAKDVADIVLMRKSLEVLHEAVIEGRKVYGNILKFIMMQISSNFGNMITVAFASIILPFLPILPTQILLIDFLYDLSQITIPSDTVDREFLDKPRKWDMKLIRRFMIVFGPISSLFDFATFFILLSVLRVSIPAFRTGWFIESIITQTLIILAIRTKKVPFYKSKPSVFLVATISVVIILGVMLALSPVGSYFSLVKMPLLFYVFVAVLTGLYFLFVEKGKQFFYARLYPSIEKNYISSPTALEQKKEPLQKSVKNRITVAVAPENE